MDKYLDKKIRGLAPLGTASNFGKTENGGKGSGNFGHAGRPGERGGSAPEGGSVKASTKAERAELEAKWKKEYEQAEYEAAVRQYESAMESYSRELQGYEESNTSLKRILADNRPFEADPIKQVIENNNRRIEEIKESGRKAITEMAAKSAQFHYGAGELKQNGDKYSVSLGNTTKAYSSIQEAQNYRAGVLGAYRSIAIAPSNVKKLGGRYEVVYDGTDLGVGYLHRDENMARAYSDGWNKAADLTNRRRLTLLSQRPQFG